MKHRFLLSSHKVKLAAALILLLAGAALLWVDLDYPGTADFACDRRERSLLMPQASTVAWGDIRHGSGDRWALRQGGGQWWLTYLNRVGPLWRPSVSFFPKPLEGPLAGALPEEYHLTSAYHLPEPVTVLAVAADPAIVRVEATLWAQPEGELAGGPGYPPTTAVTADLAGTAPGSGAFLGAMTYHREEIPDGEPGGPVPPHEYQLRLVLRGYDQQGALVARWSPSCPEGG